MRIVAGKAKGLRLKMVPGKHVRPTSDRVKESVFQILGPYFYGGMALDLFAGSGSLGLEALSRGMDRVIFNDASSQSVQTIRENVKLARMDEAVEIYRLDALKALTLFKQKGYVFSYIFLDPPYYEKLLATVVERILALGLLKSEGMMVVEYSKHDPFTSFADMAEIRQLSYGDTMISILSKG